jgi:DNA repair exonuclease SbcCD ATPase subunit
VRIREFHIGRYGPLAYRKPLPLGALNVLYGENERGKSLTIDALVKLLIGRGLKPFQRIDRVEQTPEGYILLTDQKGDTVKLPEAGRYPDFTGLTPAECANTFIIRNSDLSIVGEEDFYTSLSERLTGLRVRTIGDIKKVLQDLAHVTPTWSFRDIKGDKVKSRLERADRLTRNVDEAVTTLESRGFDSLYDRKVDVRERVEKIEKELFFQEGARKALRLRRSKEAVAQLRAASRELSDLDGYNEKDLEEWRKLEVRLEEEERKESRIGARIEKEEKEVRAIESELAGARERLRILEERKRETDENIQPLVKTCEAMRSDIRLREGRQGFLTFVCVLLAGLGFLSLAGSLFLVPGLIVVLLTALFLTGALVTGTLKIAFLVRRGRFDSVFSRLEGSLARFGVRAADLNEARRAVQSINEEHAAAQEGVTSIENRRSLRQGRIASLREELGEDRLEVIRRGIGEIRSRCALEGADQYAEIMNRKRALQQAAERNREFLTREYGEPGVSDRRKALGFWEKSIAELAPENGQPAGGVGDGDPRTPVFDERRVETLRAEREREIARLEEIEREVNESRGILDHIEREYNEVFSESEEHAYCTTTADLTVMRERLAAMRAGFEEDRRVARLTQDIFEEIEGEEREKITDLFGSGNPVTKLFEEVTGGAYSEVVLDPGSSRIGIRRVGGSIVESDKLSLGTFDQLYMSIRLALAEELLRGETGFFIMDDPFIRSDPNRLRRQFDILGDITARGWQVLYFTAKGEIKDLAEEKARINPTGIHSVDLGAAALIEV